MTRLNKLGFWNRLAFVAFVIAMIVLPLWGVVYTNQIAGDGAGVEYRLCVETAEQNPKADLMSADQVCMDQLKADLRKNDAGWDDYFIGAALTFVLCLIVYGIIGAIAAVSKWVWRGRTGTQRL